MKSAMLLIAFWLVACTTSIGIAQPPIIPPCVCAYHLIPASSYTSSHQIQTGVLPYGQSVIHSIADTTGNTWVEYTEYFTPCAGAYIIEVEFASAESRPVTFSITMASGAMVSINALSEITGGWGLEHQQSKVINTTPVFITAGNTHIRLERNGPFPHIRTIRFIPR